MDFGFFVNCLLLFVRLVCTSTSKTRRRTVLVSHCHKSGIGRRHLNEVENGVIIGTFGEVVHVNYA